MISLEPVTRCQLVCSPPVVKRVVDINAPPCPGHHVPSPARRPPLEPQAQRTLASGRADRARPAVSGMLGAHTDAVKRQMNRVAQQQRCLVAPARRRPPRPESIRTRRRPIRVGRGQDSALTGPSPGARGACGSRRDRAAWQSAAADPHNAGTPEHQWQRTTRPHRGEFVGHPSPIASHPDSRCRRPLSPA